MPYVFQSSPRLKSIHFLHGAYKKAGYIDIFLTNLDSRPELEAVVKLLSNSGVAPEFYFYQRKPNEHAAYYNFIRIDLSNCRKAIDTLHRNELISASDRADIEGEIRKAEKSLEQKNKSITTI